MQELTDNAFEQVLQAKPMQAFDPRLIALLDDLSQRILSAPTTRAYPDLATLGFFLRRKNLDRSARRYLAEGEPFLLGRGLAFHIGPANVPLNFAYSLTASLLAGNPSIVRVSSRIFPQVDLFVQALQAALRSAGLVHMVSIVRYAHDCTLNERLSQACDIRVIWGGDQTIETFARLPVPATTVQIHFADRYSAAVLDAQYYLDHCEAVEVAQKFFNDVYPFEQNACTAPKLVFWLGDEAVTARAKEQFWTALRDVMARAAYQPAEGVGVRHFRSAVQLAVSLPVHRALSLPGLTVLDSDDVDVAGLQQTASEGFFLQRRISTLAQLDRVLDQRCQTLAYVGDIKPAILSTLSEQGMRGVDRVVPMGTTAHFSFLWEGKDLIRLMTRSFEQ